MSSLTWCLYGTEFYIRKIQVLIFFINTPTLFLQNEIINRNLIYTRIKVELGYSLSFLFILQQSLNWPCRTLVVRKPFKMIRLPQWSLRSAPRDSDSEVLGAMPSNLNFKCPCPNKVILMQTLIIWSLLRVFRLSYFSSVKLICSSENMEIKISFYFKGFFFFLVRIR